LRGCDVREMRVNKINGNGIAIDGSMHESSDVHNKFEMKSDVPKKLAMNDVHEKFAMNTLLTCRHV